MKDTDLPKIKTEVIELRLPESLVNDIKVFSNRLDIEYDSWIKFALYRAVKEQKGNLPKTYKAKK